MSITLNDVNLGTGVQWVNEFSQQQVSQTVQRTLAGSTVVYHGQRTSGFPIHLESGSDHGWVKRDVVKALNALANQSGTVMTLSIRGESYQAMFDQSSPLEAVPLFPMAEPTDSDYYKIKIKLITV